MLLCYYDINESITISPPFPDLRKFVDPARSCLSLPLRLFNATPPIAPVPTPSTRAPSNHTQSP
ncbi:hypothetical protein E2C01_094708 [Portunus trituberculatus]|uniref:Uncharacterized protein n=1 Tax=Portunus trituberculatus TaxID=210409 RepID=A0A5B7JT33_PORTR|nr:hypothetical protein [Portunus trituberculatus]